MNNNIFRPIIELDGEIISVWKGTSKQGKPINLAEFINREDGKRYVLTSPDVLVKGLFWCAVTQNYSEMSYGVIPITKERLDKARREAEEHFNKKTPEVIPCKAAKRLISNI